jgi:hypothetical protein
VGSSCNRGIDRVDDRGGTGRRTSFWHRAQHDGVCRPGAVGAFQWYQTRARRHHQDRQCAPAAGLVESAWHYRHHAFVGDTLRARQRGAPAAIVAQAWTAQQRLYRRSQRLAARGKPKQHIVTAVARELTGFVWAALTH